ncbi:ion transporter [Teredinibacter sp. KSP-S5-2]|uniref:ion transporter n=1 Tax=Teredinibacter sp. KSP-S5-2 TaxID=3034506 RepID=UPI002934BF44|nr:ion transporter [Teredinibacter sp. KSP-S5-2]WNO07661.1 ion transporter [Teredinibacter sp. KSP-S5-2]
MQASQIVRTFAEVRSNRLFETFVVSVIIFSAIVVGVKTYDIPEIVAQIVHILDWLITVIFLVEITIRFIGEERKRDFFKNGWNIFDTTIVIVSLIPIDNSELAVIGRLIRIFRVLRMVSIIPELRTLLVSLIKALPQLFYVVLLMFIIFYIYAAVGSTFFSEINPELWGDIAVSLLTLFRVMTFEDWTDVMYETMTVHGWSWAYYITFIFFTAFAFLNMIIGIVVNVMEQEHREHMQEGFENEHKELDTIKNELAEIKLLLQQQANRQA